jgi:hypothetical protein
MKKNRMLIDDSYMVLPLINCKYISVPDYHIRSHFMLKKRKKKEKD